MNRPLPPLLCGLEPNGPAPLRVRNGLAETLT